MTRRSKPLTTNPQSVRDYRDSNLSSGDVPNLAAAPFRVSDAGKNEDCRAGNE